MTIRVLIAEDAVLMRSILRLILEDADYAIVGEVPNGAEAVEAYARLRPDIVTMDVIMPTKNGIDATREICDLDPHACVIMCSAVGEEAMVADAMRAGAKGFIAKPFDPQRVVDALRQALPRA